MFSRAGGCSELNGSSHQSEVQRLAASGDSALRALLPEVGSRTAEL